MRNKRLAFWSAITLTALACVIIPTYVLLRKARLTATESGQRALLVEVSKQLELYHNAHGSYPRALSELHITTFADGSTPATLEQFRYTSEGSTFTLSCNGVASHQTITIRPDSVPTE